MQAVVFSAGLEEKLLRLDLRQGQRVEEVLQQGDVLGRQLVDVGPEGCAGGRGRLDVGCEVDVVGADVVGFENGGDGGGGAGEEVERDGDDVG